MPAHPSKEIESTIDIDYIAGLEEHIAAVQEPACAEPLDFPPARNGDAQWIHPPNVIGFNQRGGQGQIFTPGDNAIAHITPADMNNHLRLAHCFLHGRRIREHRRRRARLDLFAFATRGQQRRQK